MGLDGTLGCPQREASLLVGVATNETFEYLPLARRQCPGAGTNVVQTARAMVMSEGPFNGAKQLAGRYRLGQEAVRTCLQGPHDGRSVGMPVRNMIGSVAPSSFSRVCRAGPSKPGICTSRMRQLGSLLVGSWSSNCWAEA
jgi:hypothetical protein